MQVSFEVLLTILPETRVTLCAVSNLNASVLGIDQPAGFSIDRGLWLIKGVLFLDGSKLILFKSPERPEKSAALCREAALGSFQSLAS